MCYSPGHFHCALNTGHFHYALNTRHFQSLNHPTFSKRINHPSFSQCQSPVIFTESDTRNLHRVRHPSSSQCHSPAIFTALITCHIQSVAVTRHFLSVSTKTHTPDGRPTYRGRAVGRLPQTHTQPDGPVTASHQPIALSPSLPPPSLASHGQRAEGAFSYRCARTHHYDDRWSDGGVKIR